MLVCLFVEWKWHKLDSQKKKSKFDVIPGHLFGGRDNAWKVAMNQCDQMTRLFSKYLAI